MILSLLLPLAQLAVTASAPAVVESQDELVVRVVVNSPSLLPPTIVPPPFYGFTLLRTSSTTNVAQRGSSQHAVIENQYHLVAGSPGQYMFAAFTATLDGQTARSRPVSVVVRPPGSIRMPNIPRVTQLARLDTTMSVNIAVLGTPDTVYVGEQATYEVAVFVDDASLRQRAGRNPTFTPPDLRGTLSYEIPPTRAVIPPRQIGSRIYRPHVYQRAIFPLVPGNHVVPAATLDYAMPVRNSSGLTTRESNYSLRADSVVIVALALPERGKPADFSGAVGTLRIERFVSNMALRVGEPVTVRVRVTGAANIKLLPRPALEIPWADVLAGDEKVEVEVIDGRVGGTKEFEWVVTPKIDGMQQIPSINYSYFDPVARSYSLATTKVDRIEVLPGALIVASESTFNAKPSLQIRPRDGGQVPRSPLGTGVIIAIAAVAPIPALIALLVRNFRRRRADAATAAERSMSAQSGAMYKSARRDFLSALERRLDLPVGIAASEPEFRSALLRAGVSRQTCEETIQLVQQLDAAAFSPEKGSGADSGLAALASACMRKIDSEAVRRRTARGAMFSSLLVLAVLVVPQANNVQSLFSEGIKLYRSGEFAASSERFLEVTRRRPRSVDAWANLGAAAWESGDTAAAIVSWQRALRLDPLASDVRQNLSRHSPTHTRLGWIPPVPVDPVAYAALGLWIIAGALAFRSVIRRGKFPGLPATIIALVALVLGGAAFETHRRVHDRRIAVVTRSVMSRALPALESQPLTRLLPGELVMLSQSQREWIRVSLDSRPIGWVHSSNLLRVAMD